MEPATDKEVWKLKDLGIAVPQGCTKQMANELISNKLGTPSVMNLPKKPSKPTDTSSYYVAYAKDILIQLIDSGFINLDQTPGKLQDAMMQCIDVVRQAKREFENG